MHDVYRQLGVVPIINAAGTLTRLGGGRMTGEAAAAMAHAAGQCVRIDELQAAVGAQIADWAGAEAAIVTSGAAAGLTLAAAACLAGSDWKRMDELPLVADRRCEIVVARSHRNGYDHALRAAGARIVEVGLAERTRDPQPWEIEAAIGPQTVAVAYFVDFSPLKLDEVVDVAHRAKVPVIVDASAALPPRARFRSLVATGADLVTFSGGKAIGGPQASGILCGRRALVASAALQMWDLDYLPELWDPPPSLIDPAWVARGVPNHGLGRSMKVGKEEIVGLWVALRRFLNQDEGAESARLSRMAEQVAEGLTGLPGVTVDCKPAGERWSQVWLTLDPRAARASAIDLVRRLGRGEPRVAVMQDQARAHRVGIDPNCLAADELEPLVARIRQELAAC